MPNQTTIENSTPWVRGINVYTGGPRAARFHPAGEDEGITFLTGGKYVKAIYANATNGWKAVNLYDGIARVRLVEHILSPLLPMGIDSLIIELDGMVCPTTDNGAADFYQALKEAGRETQSRPKQQWTFAANQEPVTIRHLDDGKPDRLTVGPADGFVISYNSYYPHAAVGEQEHIIHVNEQTFVDEIMHARSPAFVRQSFGHRAFHYLSERGWFGGVRDSNSLLIGTPDQTEYLNSEAHAVRYNGQEFGKHKILDILGTLVLGDGTYTNIQFDCYRSGHEFDLWAHPQLFNGILVPA